MQLFFQAWLLTMKIEPLKNSLHSINTQYHVEERREWKVEREKGGGRERGEKREEGEEERERERDKVIQISLITLARKLSHVSIFFQHSWNMVDHAMPKYMYM